MRAPIVTLLTDFGLQDGYVGAMKGVLVTRCPGVQIIDLTHAIPPGAIDAGAYALWQAAPRFPDDTVHLAVIDPGVGSPRRAVAVATGRHLYIAPDNGLLTLVLEGVRELRVHAIENSKLWEPEVSAVFHGRDLFAPVGAYLASGGDLFEVGPSIAPDTLIRRSWPPAVAAGEVRTGAVVYVDRFGNLVTNLPMGAREIAVGSVEVGGRVLRVVRTYSDVSRGELLAYRGSSGLLELACNGGSAAEQLGAGVGVVVTWRVQAGG